jgi:hypothetical protein
MNRLIPTPAVAKWLIALLLSPALTMCWATFAQALPATWGAGVDVGFSDPNLPGPSNAAPPNQPLIDVSVSQTIDTLFQLSSVTAFVSTGAGISTQGVAQVDTVVSPSPTLPQSQEISHAGFGLRFTAGDIPLVLDLSGVMHRSGGTWDDLDGILIDVFCEQGCPPSPPAPSPDLFFTGLGGRSVGDVPFEFHTVLSPGRAYSFSVLAENAPFNSTSETKVVWDLQVRPIPLPPTLHLINIGLIGLVGAATWRKCRNS